MSKSARQTVVGKDGSKSPSYEQYHASTKKGKDYSDKSSHKRIMENHKEICSVGMHKITHLVYEVDGEKRSTCVSSVCHSMAQDAQELTIMGVKAKFICCD